MTTRKSKKLTKFQKISNFFNSNREIFSVHLGPFKAELFFSLENGQRELSISLLGFSDWTCFKTLYLFTVRTWVFEFCIYLDL